MLRLEVEDLINTQIVADQNPDQDLVKIEASQDPEKQLNVGIVANQVTFRQTVIR